MDKNKVKAAIYTALFIVAIVLLCLFVFNFILATLAIGTLCGVVYLIYLGILEHLDDKDINL